MFLLFRLFSELRVENMTKNCKITNFVSFKGGMSDLSLYDQRVMGILSLYHNPILNNFRNLTHCAILTDVTEIMILLYSSNDKIAIIMSVDEYDFTLFR